MTESSQDATFKHFMKQWMKRTKDQLTEEEIQLESTQNDARRCEGGWLYKPRYNATVEYKAIIEHNKKIETFQTKRDMFNEICRIFKDSYSMPTTVVVDEKSK